jgi:prepilin-type N-terminal cleavage/methylation domain-containing protein
MRSHLLHVPQVGFRDRAFSLLELIVAMAIFLLVSASAVMLFSHQQTSATQQQGLAGLNIGIRNAIAQLQLDLANAASGNYVFNNVPIWPIGVTIVNNVTSAGSSCYDPTTATYGINCFDQLNILEPDPSPSAGPILATGQSGPTGPLNCSDTSTGQAYGQAASLPGQPPTLAALQLTASNYSTWDQLLFLTSNGSKMTTAVLNAPPTVYFDPASGQPTAVQFNFNPTNPNGSNTTGTNFNIGSDTVGNDPLDITACGGNPCPTSGTPGHPPRAPYLTNQFCSSDWIFKIAPIIYYVDTSNQSGPQLMRKQGSNQAVPIMDQVIGFKVGAAISNSINSNGTWGTSYYFYDASQYNVNNPVDPSTGIAPNPDSPYLFPYIKSIRVSLIGRTQPSIDPSFTFRNAFDGGPYLVQGASVAVSPRNLSMND